MNIFYLDQDPRRAANMLVDKHVIKMGLESVQMLCTAHREIDGQVPESFYKSAHVNHPCSKWVRECSGNYEWLWHHADQIFYRYYKKSRKTHKSESLMGLLKYYPSKLPFGAMTTPALCMPDNFKTTDPVQSYRDFYTVDKAHLHKWTYNDRPEWINDPLA